jgi:hypothetical protein
MTDRKNVLDTAYKLFLSLAFGHWSSVISHVENFSNVSENAALAIFRINVFGELLHLGTWTSNLKTSLHLIKHQDINTYGRVQV